MKERGMIFNAEMVQALLSGSKTQTRRPIKWKQTRFTEIGEREDGSKWPWSEDAENVCDYWHPCPFGAVGDRLFAAPQPAPAVEVEHRRNPVLAYADSYREMAKRGVESIPVWSVITDLERNIAPRFTATQSAVEAVPVVPDERVVFNAWNNDADCPLAGLTVKQAAWLAWLKRSGIIKSFEPVTDELPGGWVMVPVEPTEDMIIAGFESEPDETFSNPDEWEQYESMSGCQQAAHRARLCWAAMIAAVPKPE